MAPCPPWLATPILPFIMPQSCLAMARPSPVPPYLRVVEPSACANDSKMRPCFSRGTPMPLSDTSKRSTTASPLPHGADLHHDLALLGELDRVADKIA